MKLKQFAVEDKKNLLLFILFIFSLPAIFPLFHQGFFVSDDGNWMIIRFTSFHQALVHGQFPVRFLPRLNFEYGYPVANFLYPGFMYLAEPFHLVKIGFISSIKILAALSLFSSIIFTYFWLRYFFKQFAAAIGALITLYLPYHLYDLYTRGSIGEVLALGVIPFILWQIERRSIILSAVGIGILLISHNTLAALFLPLLFAYTMYRTKGITFLLTIFLGGVGLACFFWLPAIAELHYTVFSQTQVSQWQKYFADISIIGFPTLVILILSIVFLLSKKVKAALPMFFLTISLIILFLVTSLSTPLWYILPSSFIQFPFRLLSVEVICIAFLGAWLTSLVHRQQYQWLFGVILLIVVAFSALPMLTNIRYIDKTDAYFATNEDTTTVKNEYMPRWVKALPSQRPEQLILSKNVSISNLISSTNMITFTADTQKTSDVTISMIYYPGWQASIDSKIVPISYNNQKGLISFTSPAGTHQVKVWFGETPLRLVSDTISVVSLLVILYFTFMKKRFSIIKKKKQIL